MAKTKKPLTKYQRHCKREMKAGKSMKQAAASWQKAKKSGSTRSSSRGSSTTTPTTRRPGSVGKIKSLNVSLTQSYALAKIVCPDLKLLPQYAQLITYLMKGNWADAAKKAQWIGELYGKSANQVIQGILVGVGGAVAKKWLGISKVAGIGPLKFSI